MIKLNKLPTDGVILMKTGNTYDPRIGKYKERELMEPR
jgi:hypothetical protein